MPSVVTQAEQGQLPEKCKEDTESITGRSNEMDTCIDGASGGNAEKAVRNAGSVQSIENRQYYETEEEKCPFIVKVFS